MKELPIREGAALYCTRCYPGLTARQTWLYSSPLSFHPHSANRACYPAAGHFPWHVQSAWTADIGWDRMKKNEIIYKKCHLVQQANTVCCMFWQHRSAFARQQQQQQQQQHKVYAITFWFTVQCIARVVLVVEDWAKADETGFWSSSSQRLVQLMDWNSLCNSDPLELQAVRETDNHQPSVHDAQTVLEAACTIVYNDVLHAYVAKKEHIIFSLHHCTDH